MKISCLPVSLFGDICGGRMEIAQWAKAAKQIGYDSVDISVMFIKNRTPACLGKSLSTQADGRRASSKQNHTAIANLYFYREF